MIQLTEFIAALISQIYHHKNSELNSYLHTLRFTCYSNCTTVHHALKKRSKLASCQADVSPHFKDRNADQLSCCYCKLQLTFIGLPLTMKFPVFKEVINIIIVYCKCKVFIWGKRNHKSPTRPLVEEIFLSLRVRNINSYRYRGKTK